MKFLVKPETLLIRAFFCSPMYILAANYTNLAEKTQIYFRRIIALFSVVYLFPKNSIFQSRFSD